MTFSPANMPRSRPDHSLRSDRDHPLTGDGFTLSGHAAQQATSKGWSHEDVVAAANNPQITYDNGRYPDQKRHIRGDIVAVVHPASGKVVTVYQNVKETDVRPDQNDADAKRYNARRMAQ